MLRRAGTSQLETLQAIVAVALAGLAAFVTLGGAFRGSIAGDATGGATPSAGVSMSAQAGIARIVEAAAKGLEPFEHVVVDARNMRAGHGDVASAYFTALDLTRRVTDGGASNVTLLVDDDALRVLRAFRGGDVVPGDFLNVERRLGRIHTPHSLPRDTPRADLIVAAGRPSQARPHMLGFGHMPDGAPIGGARGIGPDAQLVDEGTVRIAQTVFGNTNVAYDSRPHANLWIGDRKLETSVAGIAPQHAGIYFDPVALHLRNSTAAERHAFLEAAHANVPDAVVRGRLTELLRGERLAGAEFTMAYGASLEDTHAAFSSYLRGLSELASEEGRAFAVLTPSRFREGNLASDLSERVAFLPLATAPELPRVAAPGQVYLLETPTLPHEAFVGWLAHATLPTVVSGDSSLSTAVTLGKPFVMTRVAWNRRVVEAVGTRLAALAASDDLPLVYALFPSREAALDLSHARALTEGRLADAYAGLAKTIPSFTESLLASARAVRGPVSFDNALAVDDRALRLGLLVEAAAHEPRAARLASEVLARNPERAVGMFVSGALDTHDLAEPNLRTAFRRVLAAHASPWMRAWADRLRTDPARALEDMADEAVRLAFADPPK